MITENLSQILDNLFYKEKLGIGNKNTLLKMQEINTLN